MMQLLENAQLFDPQPVGLRQLLVAAGKLLWIGAERPDLPRYLGVERIDLEGRLVIPGLIDGHAHVTGGGGESGYASSVPAPRLEHFTAAGVTTVVGVLGTDDLVRTTASLVSRVRSLVEEGLSAYCHTGGYHVPLTTLTGSVRGDIVAVDRIIGVGELALSDHRSSQPTLAELLRIAADAHVAGLMTGKAGIVHLHMGDGTRGLDMVRAALSQSELPPRVFNPTHVNRRKALFEEALALAERGCWIDITAFPESDESSWSAAAAVRHYLERDLAEQRCTVSSDGGGCLPVFDQQGMPLSMDVGRPVTLFQTLAGLLEDGLPPERALPPFTANVAALLRLRDKGRLQVGCDADLVVLDEVWQPWGVMALGRWHVREGKQMVYGRFRGADV